MFIPVALSCGHVLQEPTSFEIGGGRPATLECPEGCGMVEFVIEPAPPTYPATPVDCLISELRDLLFLGELSPKTFGQRVAQFHAEIAADTTEAG